ncbi:hypothetical protein N657DRAFT_650073 [Parathielavia appendiculata]|uniref:Uncharacterized protein n=1 Tax=Parathielavia appendiculata TaxID=2587402 RepID=A0AAN6TRT9_9PEZI|nr:hypothetical protein N657DRAFT_650073 [Parathielavia appendiculata]
MAPLPHSAFALLQTAATTLHPTRTLPHLLYNRQTTTTVTPTSTAVVVVTDTNDAPAAASTDDLDDARTLSGGAIAGIVIGSIAGFLLLVWIIRSCTNLGAPPGDEAVPGRPWYGSVRDEYPPRHAGRGRSRGRSHSHEHHHHHHHGHGASRSRSRRVSVVREAVPVQEVAPVVVRDGPYRVSREERRVRSRSRGYGYGEGPVRGRSGSRSRY